jgi:hypothetical protein
MGYSAATRTAAASASNSRLGRRSFFFRGMSTSYLAGAETGTGGRRETKSRTQMVDLEHEFMDWRDPVRSNEPERC